jgi:hypothetical protein
VPSQLISKHFKSSVITKYYLSENLSSAAKHIIGQNRNAAIMYSKITIKLGDPFFSGKRYLKNRMATNPPIKK